MGGCCAERKYEERERDAVRGKRWERGEGQRDDMGEMRELSLSTMRRSSPSSARREGLVDDGDEKEKSSNMVTGVSCLGVGIETDWRIQMTFLTLSGESAREPCEACIIRTRWMGWRWWSTDRLSGHQGSPGMEGREERGRVPELQYKAKSHSGQFSYRVGSKRDTGGLVW